MKCPNCGSENLQFFSNTNSNGFSFFDSCCGFMMLGPLGLLCGACGSGTTKEEFWICNACGKKFDKKMNEVYDSFGEEIKAEIKNYKQEKENEYMYYKEIRDSALMRIGSDDEISQLTQELHKRETDLKKEKETLLKEFIQSEKNKKFEKLYNKRFNDLKGCLFYIISFIAIFILIIFGNENQQGVGVLLFILSTIIFIISMISSNGAEEKLNKALYNENPRAKELQDTIEKIIQEKKEWEKVLEAIEFCKKYEKNPSDN